MRITAKKRGPLGFAIVKYRCTSVIQAAIAFQPLSLWLFCNQRLVETKYFPRSNTSLTRLKIVLWKFTWNHGWRLVIDANFESCGAPINKLNGPLSLDVGNGLVHILGHDITTVQHATGHIFAMAWIALDHLVTWFETWIGYFGHGQLLMVGTIRTDHWRICHQRKVDPRVRHQVGLKLIKVNI